jgi:predicted MFS family arabinose efflux permease
MSETPTGRAAAAPASRAYVLFVLTALATFNQLDRQLMNILLEPVRQEFGLSDVQLGLLTGLAFALVNTTLSIPAALWAVHHSRRDLIVAAAAFWGLMTVLSGAAQSYWQLLLARMGIGAGEAAGPPVSHALVSDLYPPGERATAMAVLAAGVNIGALLSFLVGGIVGQHYGWRMAFVVAGVPTLILALLMRLTVREPRRSADPANSPMPTTSAALVRATVRLMWTDRVLRHICIGVTLTSAVAFAAGAWVPSYIMRSHDLGIATTGLYLALVLGLGGALGTALGGRISDALRRRDVRWSLWFVALAFLATKPFSIAFYVLDDTVLALVLFALPAMLAIVYIGPTIAVLHERVPASLRPIASAVYVLLINLVGLGLGPLMTGAMSQFVFAQHGEDSLRYAMVVMQVVGIWGAAHFYVAGRGLKADPARPASP